MEPRFGHDLSHVRIHTDAAAAASARAVQARAYTAGQHIVFAAGAYRPATDDGRTLLAHELTHTLQQQHPLGAASSVTTLQRAPADAAANPVPPVSPDDMVRIVLDQRHWGAGKPAWQLEGGIPDAALTEAARGKSAGLGFETNAAIQIVDAAGNQVAFETAKFGSGSELHAEPQALGRLRVRLQDVNVTGGRMVVAVDQYACAPCMARLRYFARQAGLSGFEVWVPARDAVTPKTAATTAATRPAKMPPEATTPSYRAGARLVQGESFVPGSATSGQGWYPPLTETLSTLGTKVRAVRAAQNKWQQTMSNLGTAKSAAPLGERPVEPVAPVASREIAIQEPPASGRAVGEVGPASLDRGGGRGTRSGPRGSVGRGGGGRGSGFGFGAVALEIMHPEIARQAKAEAKAAEIARKLARYDREIAQRLEKRKADIAALQVHKNSDERVYLNVVYEVHHFEFSVDVYLKSVDVTTQNVNDQRRYSTVRPEKGWATGREYDVRREVDEFTYSLEVRVYSDAELERLATLSNEYLTAKRVLLTSPGDQAAAERLAKARQEIVDTFGTQVWVLSL